MMEERHCMRCGKKLRSAESTYVVQIRVFAGFDGILSEPEEGVDVQLRNLLDQVEQADPEELEKNVYEEFSLLLCKSCRDRFVEETKHPWEGLFQARKDPDRFVH
ncbi:MAG: hypothetical protein ACUVWO_06865 [Thermodesulfobacteriota bacterium]